MLIRDPGPYRDLFDFLGPYFVVLGKLTQRMSFPIQKIMLQMFAVILRENNDEFSEEEKKGGGTPIQKK